MSLSENVVFLLEWTFLTFIWTSPESVSHFGLLSDSISKSHCSETLYCYPPTPIPPPSPLTSIHVGFGFLFLILQSEESEERDD